jgi:hypothetical protein
MSFNLSDIINISKELRLRKIREDIQKHRAPDVSTIVPGKNSDNMDESIKRISTQSTTIPKATKQAKRSKTVKATKTKKTGLTWTEYRRTRIRKKNESYNAFQKRIASQYHKQKVKKAKKVTKKPKISGTSFKDYVAFRKAHSDDRTVSVAWAKHKKKLAKSPTLNYDKIIRDNRNINNTRGRVVQTLPLNINYNKSLQFNINKNPIINYFNDKHKDEIRKAYHLLSKDKNATSKFVISLKYIAELQTIDKPNKTAHLLANDMEGYKQKLKEWKRASKVVIQYTKFSKLDSDIHLPAISVNDSLLNYRIIGYSIKFFTPDMKGLDNVTYYKLKAFHPSSNPKYHKMCSYSTSTNKLCIYESFLHITGILSGNKTESFNKLVESYLNNESSSVIKYVKNGLLINSLEELTKKYQTKILIIFYNSYVVRNSNDELSYIGNDRPLLIDNGELIIFKDDNINDLKDYENTEALLYQKGVHVAPFKFKIQNNINDQTETKTKRFCLRRQTLKTKTKESNNILSFTFDYENDNNNNKKVKSINIYGFVDNKKYDNKFNNIKEFVKFINSITEYKRGQISKSFGRKRNTDIFIYGYENSKNDNIYLYNELYSYDPSLKYCFVNNTVKYIEYKNCYIYDLSLFYKGGVETIHNDMKLASTENKTIQLYNIGNEHLKNCIGNINNKNYDVRKTATVSKLSQTIFRQTFLKYDLYGSNPKIIKKERESYFGGKNEIYKKYFESSGNNDKLYYYDINSAHSASMLEDMPKRWIDTYEADETQPYKLEHLTKHYLYLANVEYVGDDKFYIPNLMVRNGDAVNSVLKTGYHYYWGAELIEAIKDGCDIYVKEIDVYEKQKIFDNFANYFYDKKKENKKENKFSQYSFNKNVLTNLYGKFSQKPFHKTAICNDISEEFKLLKGDVTKLISQKYIGDSNRSIIEYIDDNAEYSIGQLVRFSSYISCLTRCKLAQAMRIVGHENVYYCATDSIFTSIKLPDNMISNKLGDWELEAKINKAYFISSGNYWYQTDDDKENCKAKAFDSTLLNENNYIDVLNNKSVYQDFTVRFRNIENQNIKEETQNRLMKSNYNKRIFNNNESYAYENLENWINN